MNQVLKSLIQSVADNDIQKAKLAAKVILSNNTAACDKPFVNQMLSKIQNSASNFIELPHNIKDILKLEDVSVSFNEARHYLSAEEKAVFETISSTKLAVDRLSEMGLRYINSTLLYGESGTGKTSFGRYVAYKLGLPFAYLNFSECISSYLGATSKNISTVFDYIKNQKCVFMLDEIDAIGLKRDRHGDVGEMSRIVISLMQAFDNLSSDVLVLGATNRMDMIDTALLRRFTAKHEVKRLSNDKVLDFVISFLKTIDIEYSDDDDVEAYVRSCSRLQSELVNDIIAKIILSVKDNSSLKLCRR